MVLRQFERIKDGESCGVDKGERSISDCLHEIVFCELNWGASFEYDGDSIAFRTKCMGCIDKTLFTPSHEISLKLKEMLDARADGTPVGYFIRGKFNLDKDAAYVLEDLVTAYGLVLEGETLDSVKSLLEPSGRVIRFTPNVDQVMATSKFVQDLDHDDGLRKVAASALYLAT